MAKTAMKLKQQRAQKRFRERSAERGVLYREKRKRSLRNVRPDTSEIAVFRK